MIEIIAALVGGAAIGAVTWRFVPRPKVAPLRVVEPEFDGWAQDNAVSEPHEHIGHIAGTSIRGGVKHKRMYCSLCPKKWSEPCS